MDATSAEAGGGVMEGLTGAGEGLDPSQLAGQEEGGVAAGGGASEVVGGSDAEPSQAAPAPEGEGHDLFGLAGGQPAEGGVPDEAAPTEEVPHAEAPHGDGTVVAADDNVIVMEQPDGGVEILAMDTDDEGNVTVVEVDIDADGEMHGEVVEVAADGHVIEAGAIEVSPEGEVTVVEVDVDHDGAPDEHHDGAQHEEAAGGDELVFDTDDYVPTSTPGDDGSPDE